MKIGIYGDSFADPNPFPNESWIAYLKNNIESAIVDQYSSAGTSHWWSYKKFMETHEKYDTIIFCHTNPIRWPHLPKEYEGREWNTGHLKVGTIGSFEDKINRFFPFIFTDELLNFHGANIFRKVNEVCKNKNIFLINLHMETTETLDSVYDQEIHSAPFSTFMGLNDLSRWEKVVFNDKIYPTVELLTKYKIFNDLRANHLSETNNKLLGELLYSTIANKDYTRSTTLLELGIWEEFSTTTTERLKEWE
jgi:hypothetical protein